MPAKPGAPTGNRNALKHGLYARPELFPSDEPPPFVVEGELRPEIDLLRLLIARLVARLESAGDPPPSFDQQLLSLSAVAVAVARFASLIRTNHAIYGKDAIAFIEFNLKLGCSPEGARQRLQDEFARRRGTQPGNTNAVRHGQYAALLTAAERRCGDRRAGV